MGDISIYGHMQADYSRQYSRFERVLTFTAIMHTHIPLPRRFMYPLPLKTSQ